MKQIIQVLNDGSQDVALDASGSIYFEGPEAFIEVSNCPEPIQQFSPCAVGLVCLGARKTWLLTNGTEWRELFEKRLKFFAYNHEARLFVGELTGGQVFAGPMDAKTPRLTPLATIPFGTAPLAITARRILALRAGGALALKFKLDEDGLGFQFDYQWVPV